MKELIDTQWDVNITALNIQVYMVLELIDTQWDVNKAKYIYVTEHDPELIDTQWDVNSEYKALLRRCMAN